MKKLFIFMLMAIIMSISGWSQEVVTIGTGTETQSYAPVYPYYDYSVSQTLYLAEDINMAGNITNIAYYSSSTCNGRDIKIYLATTDVSSLTTAIGEENMTLVFDGTVSFVSSGWTTIELDEPFTYDGTSNLVVGVKEVTGQWINSYPSWTSTSASGRCLYKYRDNTLINFSEATNTLSKYPNIQLTITPSGEDFCYAPASVTVGDISANTATVTWVANEDESPINLQYTLASDTEWEEAITLTGLSSLSEELTGLTSNTAYKVRIQSDCGYENPSSWKNATFRTACDVVEGPTEDEPWFEDFESYTGSGQQPFFCWATPVVNNGPFVYCGHSPSCHSGSNSVEFKGSANAVVLPEFSEDIHNLRLTFWTTATNTSNGYVRVGVMSDAADTNTFELVGVCDTPANRGGSGSTGNGNLQGPFDFNTVEAESGRIALIYVSTTSATDSWNLDDFTVSIIPACAEPTSFTATAPAGHSVNLAWSSEAESVIVAYKASTDEDWTEVTGVTENPYTLTGLAPETAYTVKVGVDCGTSMAWSVEKTFSTTIACPAPTITVSGITEEGATLTWNGDAEEYTVRYKVNSATEWEETTVSENTITLQNLNPSTVYNIEVIANCGIEDGLSQAGTTSFRTECVTVIVTNANSFTEDFETLTSSDFGCWTEEAVSGSYHWTISTYGGSKVAYRTYSNGSSRLISPVLDISGLNSPYLSYNWEAHNWSSYEDSIYVYYRTSAEGEWVELAAHGSNDGSSISAVTQFNSVALPEASETYQIAFLGVGNNGYGMAIDNVTVQNVECAAPSNVVVSNITVNSVDVAWEGDGDVVAYKTNAEEDWTVVSVTSNPATIDNLTPSTVYLIKVGLTCNSGEASYSQQTSFRTECTAISEFAYNESFEGLTDSDFGCWTNNGFMINDYGAQEGSDFAYTSAGYSAFTGSIVSPIFDLTNVEHPFVTFYYVLNGSSANLSVYYRTNTGEEWTILGSPYTESDADWTFETLALPNPSATYQIKFETNLNWYSNVGIDNISILNIDCAAPSGIVVNNITGHTAEVSWLGDAIVVEYKTATDEEWVSVPVSESPETITGLNPTTAYTLRVGLDCGTGEISYSQNITFTTDIACPAPIVSVSNVTETTATVSWISEAPNAVLRYKLSGTDTWIEEDIAVSGNSYDLTGLTSSTSYIVEVAAQCEGEENPSPYGSKSFNTSCGIIASLPWFEDFESYTQDGQNQFVCWATPITDATYNGPFVYGYYSRSCHSGGYSAEMKGASNMVVLPEFAEDIHNLRLTFWTTATSTSVGTLQVGVVTDSEDPTTFELVGTCVTPASRGNQDNVAGNGNLQGPFDFATVEATSGRIALKYTSTSPSNSWNLDDFTVEVIPACAEPTGLTVSNVASHSATISYVTTAESVTVAYKADGDDDYTEITNVTENPYTLSGLAPETHYTVKVGKVCEDNTTAWSFTQGFTTTIACPAPTMTLSGITSNSVTIAYTGDAESYELKYKTSEETEWTEQTITENPYTLENLTAGTAYTIELRANCGDEDGMSQAATASFTTAFENQYEVGTESYTTSYSPAQVLYNYSLTQNLYTAEEMANVPAGNITTVSFKRVSGNDNVNRTWRISMAEVENTVLYNNGVSPIAATEFTEVYNGPVTIAGDWFNITLTTPFAYTGTNNLVVMVSDETGSWVSSVSYAAESGASDKTIYNYSDNGLRQISDLNNSTARPIVRFVVLPGDTPEPVQPEVVSYIASNITETSATLNGGILSLGNQEIIAEGFEWGLPLQQDLTVVNVQSVNLSLTYELTGLTPNTTYVYRAFVTTALGTVYGATIPFTTLSEGTPCTPVEMTITETVCYGETYSFNGQTYNTTGTYTTVVTGQNGDCDTNYTINLTVRPENTPINDEVTLNNDELPYTYHGQEFNAFGTYTVTGEDEFGCPQEYTLTLVHNSGINEVGSEFVVTLYPNPTTSNATLLVKGLTEEATIMVTDQAGRVISTTTLALGQETMEVETSALASGVYYVRIRTANSVRTEKLIRK